MGSAHFDTLLRKLERFKPTLTPKDRQTIAALPAQVEEFRRGDAILQEGSRPTTSVLTLEGFAGRFKLLSTGSRQILSIHVPGDFCDLHSRFLKVMDHGLTALSPCKVARVPHEAVAALMHEQPNVADCLAWDMAVDGAIQREWMVGLGRRSSYQRTAHLFCDLYMRLAAVGWTDRSGYVLPISQEDIGDAVGISSVHVNRIVQELRANGLIVLTRKRVDIPDLAALKEAALFDPTYLEMQAIEP